MSDVLTGLVASDGGVFMVSFFSVVIVGDKGCMFCVSVLGGRRLAYVDVVSAVFPVYEVVYSQEVSKMKCGFSFVQSGSKCIWNTLFFPSKASSSSG